MSRRDGNTALKAVLVRVARGEAVVDPLAGIPPQLLQGFLYSGDQHGRTFGPATDSHMHIHKDGYHTSHAGACAVEPAEEPASRIIRQHNLDHLEASWLRDRLAHPADKLPARARRLGIPERTLRNVRTRLAARLQGIDLGLGSIEW